MDGIRETIRNLAAFFVLSTVLLRLLPGESYARYLRFFLGLLLVISLLRPLVSALSSEDLFAEVLNMSAEAFGGDLEDGIGISSGGEWETVLAAYQGEIQEMIDGQITDLGVCVTDISVDSSGEILTFKIIKTGSEASGGTGLSATESGANGGAGASATENSVDGGTGASATGNSVDGGTGASATGNSVDGGTGASATENGANGSTDGSGMYGETSDEGKNAAEGDTAAVRIEIPVISVFAGAVEENVDRSENEMKNGTGNGNESDAEAQGKGGTLSDSGIAELVRTRIAEYCGISENFVEVIMESQERK
ncbi:MAG: stage III sporulation protein AF [Lachnospiraceae bacterium]|nr:stage III sporulation protein AF [Lachnospiraceae bacterium]